MSVKKYCYCDNNCKYETLSKEEIYAAITQAITTGSIGNCDTGFITTIKTITGKPLKFFVGTQEEYEALTADKKQNLFALITNDVTKEGLLRSFADLMASHNELKQGLISGNFVAAKAATAERATKDKNGREFEHTYFSHSICIYSGNALRGVEIYGKKGGHSYIVNLRIPSIGVYCFGLVYWGGTNITFSSEIRFANGYLVKIEPYGEYDFDNNYMWGKATLIENDYGFSIDLSMAELEFISLTDSVFVDI